MITVPFYPTGNSIPDSYLNAPFSPSSFTDPYTRRYSATNRFRRKKNSKEPRKVKRLMARESRRRNR